MRLIFCLLLLIATPVVLAAPGQESEPDTDATVQRLIDEYRRAVRSPEVRDERGVILGDVLESKLDPSLAAADFEAMDVRQLVRLADAGVLEVSREHADRALTRLEALRAGSGDVESALAAILRARLLNRLGTLEREETVQAIRDALQHPWFGRALHEFDRPGRVIPELMHGYPAVTDAIAADLLALARSFPLDAPIEVITDSLPRFYEFLRHRFADREAEIEEVRRRFVKVAANAFGSLDDDETVKTLIRRINPHRVGEEVDPNHMEGVRRHRLESLQETLAWFASPTVRGTLVGYGFPRIDFIWARRAAHDPDATPFRHSGDLQGRPAVIVAVMFHEVTQPEVAAHGRGMEMFRKLAERYRDQPVTFLALTRPTTNTLFVSPGVSIEPPADGIAALEEALAEDAQTPYAVAVVEEPLSPRTGLRYYDQPIIIDQDGRVVDASMEIGATDDLTERINGVLREGGYDHDLPALERKIAVGEPAPDIAFTWTSGGLDARSLADLRGRVVVLDFWATWCGPCIASFPQMRALREEFAEEDVVFLGVTSLQGKHYPPDGQPIVTEGEPAREHELMEQFMEQKDMTWDVVFSAESVFNPAYGVRGIPSAFIIDREGILRTGRLNPLVDHAAIEQMLEKVLAECR